LDHTLEECCRLGYAQPGPKLVDAGGELRPLTEWPSEQTPAALQPLGLKRQALNDVLKYLRYAGINGRPAPPANSVTINNVTVVHAERLSDEELDFYLALAEKGGAIPIDAPKEPRAETTS
jgi:hypothetical protein